MNNTQRGGAAVAILAVVAGLMIFAGFVVGYSWYEAKRFGNASEQSIKYTHEDLRQVLGQYSIKVQEAAQVPANYQERLEDTMVSVMSARMGEGGMKADWAWLQEAGIPYDATMEAKVQNIVEAGRNDFQNKQSQFLDRKRSYETALGSPWMGLWLSVNGYPKIDLDAYKTVTSKHSDEAFESGQDKVISF